MKNAVTTLSLILALSALGSCGSQQVCSLVGCSSGIVFHADWAATADRFDVDIASSTATGSFSCVRDTDREGAFLLDENSGTGAFAAGADAGFSAVCGGTRSLFEFRTRSEEDMPSALTVTVTADDETRSRSFDDVDYAVSQPNGEACGPTCLQTGLTIE